MAKNALDRTDWYVLAIHDRCAGMSQRMEPEVSHLGPIAEIFNKFSPVLKRDCLLLAGFVIHIEVSEDPRISCVAG